MAGKDVAAKATTTQPKNVARRLWRVLRAVLYMLRRGVLLPSGRKLAMDLSLLLRRGKIAGKVLGALVNFHHHSSAAAPRSSSSFSCRALDPALAVHEPSRGRREVEFSCSNTPSSASAGGFFGSSKRRGSNRRRRDDEAAGYYYNYDAADIARAFEMLNDDPGHLFDDDALALVATPSPALWTRSAFGRSPAAPAKQVHVTDSPFAATDSDAAAGKQQHVDRKADEFIRRFYEQLRAQKSVTATPDYYGYAASPYNGHSPRPVAAGIA